MLGWLQYNQILRFLVPNIRSVTVPVIIFVFIAQTVVWTQWSLALHGGVFASESHGSRTYHFSSILVWFLWLISFFARLRVHRCLQHVWYRPILPKGPGHTAHDNDTKNIVLAVTLLRIVAFNRRTVFFVSLSSRRFLLARLLYTIAWSNLLEFNLTRHKLSLELFSRCRISSVTYTKWKDVSLTSFAWQQVTRMNRLESPIESLFDSTTGKIVVYYDFWRLLDSVCILQGWKYRKDAI